MFKLFRTPSAWILSALAGLGVKTPAHAVESLNSLKITEVVEKVDVLDATSKRQKAARVNERFNVPDFLTTGVNSRAEMVAADGTVTRVGSNTTFSFSPSKREINLEKGSLLFHSPTGKGGGVIRSGSASAAVLGTTIMVAATTDGGFKMMVLEGVARATLANGSVSSVNAGQLVYILPGGKSFAPVTGFRLQSQVAGSALVQGFKTPLQSLGRIADFTNRQEKKIETGKAVVSPNKAEDSKGSGAGTGHGGPGMAQGGSGGPGVGPGGPGMGSGMGPAGLPPMMQNGPGFNQVRVNSTGAYGPMMPEMMMPPAMRPPPVSPGP